LPDPGTPLLAVDELTKTFRPRARLLRAGVQEVLAVREASFAVAEGGALAIVGESGSGKTTIARMLVGLEQPTGGRILLDGRELSPRLHRRERRARGRAIQIVFQDPYTSLDPRQSIRRGLDEIQRVHFDRTRVERAERTAWLLQEVGLGEKEARSLPRELSGGQRQRAAIARALAAEPRILVLDEAVSALDVSIQAQILNLLADLRADLRLTYVFISHDLAVVRQIADSVLVMYRGRVVEAGPAEAVFGDARHPYTQRLLQSVPRPSMVLRRRVAGLVAAETGCLFRHRCPHAYERCGSEPTLLEASAGHAARCWLVEEPTAARPVPAAVDAPAQLTKEET
jgi:oligopeptide/dipeptide ABC transporter ATP-binding protein